MRDIYRVQLEGDELRERFPIPERHYPQRLVYLVFSVLPIEALGTPSEARAKRWFGVQLFFSDSMEQILANAIAKRALAQFAYERAFPHLFQFVRREIERRGLPVQYEVLKPERPIPPDHEHRIIVPEGSDASVLYCSNPENVHAEEPFEIEIEGPRTRIGFAAE